MQYLPYDDWLDEAKELSSGQSVRVNHDSPDCSGSSNSLLIERKDDGNLSAYCFRCGRAGFYNNGLTLKSKTAGETCDTVSKSSSGKYTIPGDCEGEIGEWPPRARVWIDKAGITQSEVDRYGICYSDTVGRVLLPVRDSNGKLCSYQTRRIHTDDTKPKYLTYRNHNFPFYTDGARGDMRLVFVEDILSAIRVGRITPCVALLGVKLQQHHLDFIMREGFNEFRIWLDDDNLQVKKAQLDIKRSLDKVGKCLIIHTKGKDPKEHTDAEIRSILL